MAEQQPQQQPKGGNPFASLSHEQLKEVATRQAEIIQRLEADINNVLSLYVSLCKLNMDWGRALIATGQKMISLLHPEIQKRIPRDLLPGELPADFGKEQEQIQQGTAKSIEELKKEALRKLESEDS